MNLKLTKNGFFKIFGILKEDIQKQIDKNKKEIKILSESAGHSNDITGTGDEGWIRLHDLNGQNNAYENIICQINEIEKSLQNLSNSIMIKKGLEPKNGN